MFFYFLFFILELWIACQLITLCPWVSCLPDSVDQKEDPHFHKTILKTRDPRYEIENEVTNSETLNPETIFSQAFDKVVSFLLALDLMHKCYVISFPDVFHFLIWRSNCFVAYFHLSTSQKL